MGDVVFLSRLTAENAYRACELFLSWNSARVERSRWVAIKNEWRSSDHFYADHVLCCCSRSKGTLILENGGVTLSLSQREKKNLWESQAGCPIVSSTSRNVLCQCSASPGPILSQKMVPPVCIYMGLGYPAHCAVTVGVVWISLGPSLTSRLAPVLSPSCSLRSCIMGRVKYHTVRNMYPRPSQKVTIPAKKIKEENMFKLLLGKTH